VNLRERRPNREQLLAHRPVQGGLLVG